MQCKIYLKRELYCIAYRIMTTSPFKFSPVATIVGLNIPVSTTWTQPDPFTIKTPCADCSAWLNMFCAHPSHERQPTGFSPLALTAPLAAAANQTFAPHVRYLGERSACSKLATGRGVCAPCCILVKCCSDTSPAWRGDNIVRHPQLPLLTGQVAFFSNYIIDIFLWLFFSVAHCEAGALSKVPSRLLKYFLKFFSSSSLAWVFRERDE